MKGIVTARDEFLFEGDVYGEMPGQIEIPMARNAAPGVQIYVNTEAEKVSFSLEAEGFSAEWYQMVSVPVEYNTGDGQEQGGAMVIVPEEKPDYAVRKAPFWVYDCLKPIQRAEAETKSGVGAAYVCLRANGETRAGTYAARLKIAAQEETHVCEIKLHVYNVQIPDGGFGVTNWFSPDAICRFHGVEQGSGDYEAMLKKYASAMRRTRQNTFYLELDDRCVCARDPYRFDFSYLKRTIEIFFAAGMDTIEIGPLLSRGFLPDGLPDMYTSVFRCAMAPDVPVESLEGYEITTCFVRTLAEFLRENGWEKNVVFHIHDEPDVHYKNEHDLNERKRQYFYAVTILKKYLPDVRVIEAVKTTEFKGGIDIWVPVTSSFEEQKQEFLKLMELGEEVWNYVCCVPEGNWLNRFLDDAVLHSRLMFWGFARSGVKGYLHWGFNIFQMGMDPFTATSCPNHTGIGTNFPCGDAFIVYPGEDGPWISMRLEEQRRGAEDAELLRLLYEKDAKRHRELIGRIFTNHYTYEDDPGLFLQVYEELLRELEE